MKDELKVYEIWFPKTQYNGGMGDEINNPARLLGKVSAASPHKALFSWAAHQASPLELDSLEFKNWTFYLNGSILTAKQLDD